MMIEKRVSAPHNAAKTSLYHQERLPISLREATTELPLPQTAPDKFVPSILLQEVTIEVISNAALYYISAIIIEAMNQATAGKACKVIAVKQLQSGDFIETANCPALKALPKQES